MSCNFVLRRLLNVGVAYPQMSLPIVSPGLEQDICTAWNTFLIQRTKSDWNSPDMV